MPASRPQCQNPENSAKDAHARNTYDESVKAWKPRRCQGRYVAVGICTVPEAALRRRLTAGSLAARWWNLFFAFESFVSHSCYWSASASASQDQKLLKACTEAFAC